MVALWKSIWVQDEPGASLMSFSRVQNKEWAKLLMEDFVECNETVITAQNCFFQMPVWQDIIEQGNKGWKESL